MSLFPLLMFPFLIVLLFLGFPIAFGMIATALVFGLVIFEGALIHQFAQKIDDISTNFVFAAVPLFIFMGAMLAQSGVAAQLYGALSVWTRRFPGGLAIATILLCVVFAACSGIVGATETVIGLLAIPPMLERGYNKELIVGTITGGGSLGTIIPPSVIVIVLAPLANVPVGDLLFGIAIPGLLMAGFFVVYVAGLCLWRPRYGPPDRTAGEGLSFGRKVAMTATAMVPPIVLILAVLGSIMVGLAAVTEAAALGAAGSIGLALAYRRLTVKVLWDTLLQTIGVTAMIMTIVVGGSVMAGVFIGGGGGLLLQELVDHLQVGQAGLLAIVLSIAFVLGFLMDWISIALILVPIFTPLLKAAGVDMVWFCVLLLIVFQTSYLTPPMAPAIFYFRAISPPEITTAHMYRGVIPFIVLQLLTLAATLTWPELALWLPKQLFTGF
ncbi:MAG: TRAP transporter large permease subunit [Alphaproteobacteria bacterium]|nr:TRAP transporter large permease subunit [Alphaproteobacteria bacterium]